MAVLLELQGASKTYGRKVALRPIDVCIQRGEVLVLLGESGSGKSTLLRLLAGLDAPTSGSVLFEGHPVDAHASDAYRRRLGYVVQGGGLFPHLTAEQNVTLVARHLGWAEPRIRARVDALVALTRLPPDALSRYPVQLSGGQVQRLGLMRALMLDPDLLLLDEPLGALDPITRYELQQDLRAIFSQLRRTVVLVTHDLAEAGFFAERVMLLRDGALVQGGLLSALLEQPIDDFARRFVQAQRASVVSLGART